MSTSRSFKFIAIGLLIWNLIGVAAFAMQYGADLATLAESDPYTARIFAEMPDWAWAAYAVAVGAGTAGAMLLLLRKAAAVALFALSMVAVVVQFGYSFLGTDLWTVKGAAAAVFPAVIFAIAVGQWLYSIRLRARGVLR